MQNLPFASFVREGETKPRLAAAIGDQLLDVTEAFGIDSMRLAMAMEKQARVELRHRISRFLTEKGRGGGIAPDADRGEPADASLPGGRLCGVPGGGGRSPEQVAAGGAEW